MSPCDYLAWDDDSSSLVKLRRGGLALALVRAPRDHPARQIISVVTVETADRSSAVAVAPAVVSEALWRPAASPSR